MANPQSLTVATKLYSAAEPEGRVFQAGESWPGDAWSINPGGSVAGANTVGQAMKDLIEAQDQNEALGRQLANKDYSLAEANAAKEAALAKVNDLEQRAIAAEAARADAETAAKDYMIERDQARAQVQAGSGDQAKIGELQAEADKVPGLMAQLDTANQALADANGKIDALTAKKAKAAPEAAPEAPAEPGAQA